MQVAALKESLASETRRIAAEAQRADEAEAAAVSVRAELALRDNEVARVTKLAASRNETLVRDEEGRKDGMTEGRKEGTTEGRKDGRKIGTK